MTQSDTDRDSYDVHVVDKRVTPLGDAPVFEASTLHLERGNDDDFIMLVPTKTKGWIKIPGWHACLIHIITKPVDPKEMHMTLPRRWGDGLTKKRALANMWDMDEGKRVMVAEFAIAIAEGRVRMAAIEIEPEEDE